MAREQFNIHPGVGRNRASDGAILITKSGTYFAWLEQQLPASQDKVTFIQGITVPPGLLTGPSDYVKFRVVFRQATADTGQIVAEVLTRWLDFTGPPPNRDAAPLVGLSAPAPGVAVMMPGAAGGEVEYEFSVLASALGIAAGQELLLGVARVGTAGSPVDTFPSDVFLVRADVEFPIQADEPLYTNLTPVPDPLGGVLPGDTFTSQTMTQMFDTLLYPYQFPAFTSFTIASHPSGLIECGDGIVSPATFNWARTNQTNITANSIFIFDNTSAPPPPPQTLGSSLPDILTAVLNLFAHPAPLVYTAPATHQFQIRGQNTRTPPYPPPSGYFTRNLNLTWAFRRFYGRSALVGPLTEAQIEALANNPIASGFAGTYNFPAVPSPGQYCYICVAQAAGTPSDFIDTDTGLNVAMNLPYTVSVTNTYGVTENYDVYRTTYQIIDALNIAVS